MISWQVWTCCCCMCLLGRQLPVQEQGMCGLWMLVWLMHGYQDCTYVWQTITYTFFTPANHPRSSTADALLAPSSRASKARQDKQCSQQHIQGYAISQVNLTCTHMITVTQHSLKPQTCHQSYTCLGVPAIECIRMQVGCIIYAQTSTVPTYSMILQHTCAAQADLHSWSLFCWCELFSCKDLYAREMACNSSHSVDLTDMQYHAAVQLAN